MLQYHHAVGRTTAARLETVNVKAADVGEGLNIDKIDKDKIDKTDAPEPDVRLALEQRAR